MITNKPHTYPSFFGRLRSKTSLAISGIFREHAMSKSLRAYLSKEIVASDFVIHYYIGGGLSGETDLRLRGDGRYDLWSTVTEGYQRKSYSGEVPISQVEEVALLMLTTKIWQVRHDQGGRGLDESGAKIAVEAGSQKSALILWISEIRESASFVVVQRQLLTLIHEVSAGEVREYGRGTRDIPYTIEIAQTAKGLDFQFPKLKRWVEQLAISIQSYKRAKEPTRLER